MKTYRVSMVVVDDYSDREDTAFTEAELRGRDCGCGGAEELDGVGVCVE